MLTQALVVLLAVSVAQAAVDNDLIKSLPGLDKMPSYRQYSGYLKATEGRQLHYWLIV